MKKSQFTLLIIAVIGTFSYNSGFSQEDDPTVRRAIYMINKGECDQALKMLDMSLTKYGESEMIYLYKGQSYACLFMYEDALENYNKALEINQYYEKALFSRGKLYIENKEKEKGCTDLKSAFNLGYDKEKEFYIDNCPEQAEKFIRERFLVYKYESDDFSIFFPQMYEEYLDDAGSFKVTSVECKRNDDFLLVVLWNYTEDIFNASNETETIVKLMIEGVYTRMYPGGKLISNATTFNGYNGFDLNYTTENEKVYGKTFYNGNKLYLISFTTQKKEMNLTELNLFYNSFILK